MSYILPVNPTAEPIGLTEVKLGYSTKLRKL